MTFKPLPAVEEPIWSILNLISASLAKAGPAPPITAAVAAVEEVIVEAPATDAIAEAPIPALLYCLTLGIGLHPRNIYASFFSIGFLKLEVGFPFD